MRKLVFLSLLLALLPAGAGERPLFRDFVHAAIEYRAKQPR